LYTDEEVISIIILKNIHTQCQSTQILIGLKGEADTITSGDFNTPPSAMTRSPRQKTNKGAEFSCTTEQMDLTDTNRTVHPTAVHFLLNSVRKIHLGRSYGSHKKIAKFFKT
jgi:hypothetical protein